MVQSALPDVPAAWKVFLQGKWILMPLLALQRSALRKAVSTSTGVLVAGESLDSYVAVYLAHHALRSLQVTPTQDVAPNAGICCRWSREVSPACPKEDRDALIGTLKDYASNKAQWATDALTVQPCEVWQELRGRTLWFAGDSVSQVPLPTPGVNLAAAATKALTGHVERVSA